MEAISIPLMQIVPSGVVCYEYWNGPRRKNKTSFNFKSFDQLQEPSERKAYTGILRPGALRKLRWSINLLVSQAKWKDAYNSQTNSTFKFKVNFITLTLPAAQRGISDKAIKKDCLSRWIDTMRSAYGLHAYVWRAERQYNGNIHFHITTDTYLPWDAICSVWNHFLARYHFIDEYQERNGAGAPNSTDVHSVQAINNLAAYMVKYMSKDPIEHLKDVNKKLRKKGSKPIVPDNHPWRSIPSQPKWTDPIEGAVWDCSMNLKTKKRVEFEMDNTLSEWVSQVMDSDPDRCYNGDRFLFISMSDSEKKRYLNGRWFNEYQAWLKSIQDS